MSKLRIRPEAKSGRLVHVTPASAGWTYVGFDLHKLASGGAVEGNEPARETCLVMISGKARIKAGGNDFGTVGERMSPFEGRPASVYVPAGASWSVTAT